MRCAYQAYDLHAAVGRIKHQRANLSAKRFYTITAITMPDALRLSGLRFTRCRRPDKAPARRFVCRTVLHNNRNPLCLMRCAYQAYDLHATVGRIRRQRADLYAKRFYTITAITMPDALRLSGLRFARCRRPDKAPVHRFVCRTVLQNNRNPLCLMRCAYQAYDLHATVGRIRRQRRIRLKHQNFQDTLPTMLRSAPK